MLYEKIILDQSGCEKSLQLVTAWTTVTWQIGEARRHEKLGRQDAEEIQGDKKDMTDIKWTLTAMFLFRSFVHAQWFCILHLLENRQGEGGCICPDHGKTWSWGMHYVELYITLEFQTFYYVMKYVASKTLPKAHRTHPLSTWTFTQSTSVSSSHNLANV